MALFERRNRAIFLTPAGRALHGTTLSVFEQLQGAVHRLQQQARENVLVLSCEPTIAMKWLIPRLPAFHAAHPDIHLHLVAAGGPIDFSRSGVDLALRRDDFRWDASLHALKICDEWVGPVSSVNLATASQGLDGQRLLHSASRPNAWSTWLRLTGESARDTRRADYEHFYLCIQAAVAGLGVAMASFLMVQDEIDSGQLQAPRSFVQDQSAYYLLCQQTMADDDKCRRFAQWVSAQAEACLAHLL